MTTKIELQKKVQTASQQIAEELKTVFENNHTFTINIIGSPGAGKTSLLESLAPHLKGFTAVIEGDLQTDEDKVRIENAGLPAYQINTNGACHLDAKMIQNALLEFPLDGIRLLFIENVGNLVCPASFELGEHIKIAVISVTEGDDKPAKYPKALRVASALILTKTDLAPYIKCNINRMEKDALAINSELKIFQTNINNPESFIDLSKWLKSLI